VREGGKVKGKGVKEKKIGNELLDELRVMEGKIKKILEDVEALTKKPKPDSQEIETLVRRLTKLIDDFRSKLEYIKKLLQESKKGGR